MIDFTGKIALVTGASIGIGRATAEALARAGADVALGYRQDADGAEETRRLVEALGRKALPMQADVSYEDQAGALVARVVKELGPVDILINNAGWAKLQAMETITGDDWDDVFRVNLKSAFLMTQAVLPAMQERRWGRIVNVGSGAASSGGSRARKSVV